MRVLATATAVLAMVAALSSGARADDDADDEDGEYIGVPKRSIGISFGGHGTRIDDKTESGFGPTLELALGKDRWQYFLEGGFASSNLTMTPNTVIGGRVAHGGLGLRWIARQFRPDSSGGIELFLLTRAGLQRYYLDNDMRMSRPELALGFGLQGRLYKRPRFAFRLDMRILATPDETPGFSCGFGVAW